MITRKVKIRDVSGLHLRPAEKLSGTAMGYRCRITFDYAEGRGQADAKSVLGVLGACVRCGDEIVLKCEGPDEEEAMRAILACLDAEIL